ncbi:MAG: hypothetical protein WD795_02525 [Woeseia sp.]
MKEPDKTDDTSDDGRLAERARQLFDESVRELDAETLSRLNRSRHNALAELKSGSTDLRWLRWTPAAAVAAAAVAAVVVWRAPDLDQLPSDVASDFEMLLAEEELEMLEDLEFYRWLALDETAEETGADDHVG